MHRVWDSSYSWVQLGKMKTRNKTRQRNITLNLTTSHLPHFPFLLLNTLNKEFSTTSYCVTQYKEIYIASPWGSWVSSWYWDWKTWIWSQSSPKAVVGGSQAWCRLIVTYCRVFLNLTNLTHSGESCFPFMLLYSFGLSYCYDAVILFSVTVLSDLGLLKYLTEVPFLPFKYHCLLQSCLTHKKTI